MEPMSRKLVRRIFATAFLATPASYARAELPGLGAVRSVLLDSGLVEPASLPDPASYQGRGGASKAHAELLAAVESRQRLNRFLAEHARLVSKEVLSETRGDLNGSGASIFGIGGMQVQGAFSQTVYDHLLKGGRVFAVSTGLGPKAQAFLKRLDPQSTYPCATALRDRLHRVVPTAGLDTLERELAVFRSAMYALELSMVGRESEPDYKTFADLRDWARSTYLMTHALEAGEYEFIDATLHGHHAGRGSLAGVRFFGPTTKENFRCLQTANVNEALATGFYVDAKYHAVW